VWRGWMVLSVPGTAVRAAERACIEHHERGAKPKMKVESPKPHAHSWRGPRKSDRQLSTSTAEFRPKAPATTGMPQPFHVDLHRSLSCDRLSRAPSAPAVEAPFSWAAEGVPEYGSTHRSHFSERPAMKPMAPFKPRRSEMPWQAGARDQLARSTSHDAFRGSPQRQQQRPFRPASTGPTPPWHDERTERGFLGATTHKNAFRSPCVSAQREPFRPSPSTELLGTEQGSRQLSTMHAAFLSPSCGAAQREPFRPVPATALLGNERESGQQSTMHAAYLPFTVRRVPPIRPHKNWSPFSGADAPTAWESTAHSAYR